MKFKHRFLLTALVVLLGGLALGCERELPQPDAPARTVQASGLDGLPAYTAAKYQTLLGSQTDESDLVEKTRLLAYTLTRYLGENATTLDITDAADVERVLPCDQGWPGDAGNLRTLATASGGSIAAVKAGLSAILLSRIEGLDLPQAQAQADVLLDGLLAGLAHQGRAYGTRNYYPAANPATAATIFVSYGVSYRAEGYVALGFRWPLATGQLAYAELPITQALAEGVLLLDHVEVNPDPGTARYNDPCHNGPVYGGGGGNGNGNGGSWELDDDGNQKNGFTGGLVSPPPTLDIQCQGASGVRITQMHLAHPYEAVGKSEVYVNVTVYQSNDQAATVKTNDQSSKTKTLNFGGVLVTYRVGKQLADAPASAFSATSGTIISPASGYTPNGGDWVLLDEGFCDLLYDGYNRMAISLVELDGGIPPTHQVDQPTLLTLPYDDQQWAKQKYATDRWARSEVQPSDFDGDNEVYIIKSNGGFFVSQTQPGNASSWVRLERF
jgi:hypothetical protein